MPSSLLNRSASFDQNTAATHEVVAAITGYRIVVVGYHLVSGGTNTVVFKSGSTARTGAIPVAAAGNLAMPPVGPLFATTAGAALNITLSGAQQLAGYVIYRVEE